MNTLYLAWQDAESRRWFPVGRLDADADAETGQYQFLYIHGAHKACESTEFLTIPGFPEIANAYQSISLFPFFRNRLMNPGRRGRPEYLRRLGISTDEWNPLLELSATAGYNDDFELFPSIVADFHGRFASRFILYGLCHQQPDAIRRTESLEPGEALNLSPQTDHPAATLAIKVCTQDGHHVGWLPRYLVDGLHQDGAWMVADAKATVAQVNLDAPLSHRLLIDFTGKLPPGFRMADLPQYQPIAPPAGDYPTNKSSGKNADTV